MSDDTPYYLDDPTRHVNDTAVTQHCIRWPEIGGIKTLIPAYTSKTCHCCGETGYRLDQATFACSNSECWVSEYQADVNAALNIADRYLSGESHSREHTDGDDSAGEGGRLTVPQDSQADADTQQVTLGTNAS